MDGQFGLLWPNWPAGASGTTCVDVQIGWSVDTTFDKLWGAGSEFSVSPAGFPVLPWHLHTPYR